MDNVDTTVFTNIWEVVVEIFNFFYTYSEYCVDHNMV